MVKRLEGKKLADLRTESNKRTYDGDCSGVEYRGGDLGYHGLFSVGGEGTLETRRRSVRKKETRFLGGRYF